MPPLLARLAIFFSLCAVLLTGCQTTDTGTDNALRVGCTPNYPPIIYKENGRITGVEAEFARKLGARLDRPVRFVEMPFDRLLSALDAGKIDIIMSGMTVTAARTPLAQFCAPYGTTGQALMVRSEDLWTYSYPDVIYVIKTRIGVEKGTIGDMIAQRRCPQAKVSTFSSTEAAIRALKAKQVDVVLADAPLLWRIAAQSEGAKVVVVRKLLTTEELAWAVQRGNTGLLNAANSALAQWRADGTLAGILSAYMPLAQ